MSKIRVKSVGKTLEKQTIDGKSIVFRYPKPSDTAHMVKTINSLINERVDIAKTTKVTFKEEKEWLVNVLKSIRKKERIMIVVEVDGVVVGSCEVIKDTYDVSRHVGTLGIGLRKEIRGIGIGKKLVELCLTNSKKKLGLKIIKLYVFNTNKTARSFYKRFGFKEAGRIQRGVYHNFRYKDDIIMIKWL
jgi:RimJ/RimL family protein N-acetyltransferase